MIPVAQFFPKSVFGFIQVFYVSIQTFKIICFSSVKNAIVIVIGIALRL